MSYTFNLTNSQVDNIIQTELRSHAFGLARDVRTLKKLKDLKDYEKEDLENDLMYLEHFKAIITYYFIDSEARRIITEIDEVAYGEDSPQEE